MPVTSFLAYGAVQGYIRLTRKQFRRKLISTTPSTRLSRNESSSDAVTDQSETVSNAVAAQAKDAGQTASESSASTSGSTIPAVTSSVTEQLESTVDNVNINNVNNVNGKPVTVSVMSSISDYLSNELGVLSALCAAVPPVVDLGMFKPTLTEQQLYSAFSTAMRKVAVFSRILHFCLSLNGKASRTNREQYCRMIAVSWTRHSEVYLICLGM